MLIIGTEWGGAGCGWVENRARLKRESIVGTPCRSQESRLASTYMYM